MKCAFLTYPILVLRLCLREDLLLSYLKQLRINLEVFSVSCLSSEMVPISNFFQPKSRWYLSIFCCIYVCNIVLYMYMYCINLEVVTSLYEIKKRFERIKSAFMFFYLGFIISSFKCISIIAIIREIIYMN